MSLTTELLKATGGRALGTVIYGGAGLQKSLAKHTLPYPILDFDFEGGNVALLPWMRRVRKWNEKSWTEVSQAEREAAYDLLPRDEKGNIKAATPIRPQGLIDSIWYDNMNRGSYFQFTGDLGNFDTSKYNSLSLDSLAEFSFDVVTSSKPADKENEAYQTGSTPWDTIQERTAIGLRRMRNYRDSGVFVYMTGTEQIDKDYVKDPRSKAKGESAPEAFSIKGTVNVPGKMVAAVQHTTDLMFHTRLMNGEPAWITYPEPLPGGDSNWEAKDRTGRVKSRYIRPNFRTLLIDIYGEEGRDAIYASSKELLAKG